MTINVFVAFDGTNWNVDQANPPAQGKKPIDVPGTTPQDITFHCVTQGVNFVQSDPIWVTEGSNCPQSPSNSAQISVKTCSNNTLQVHDANNGGQMTLTYSLNFTGAPACDPIIRNGGTSSSS